MLIFAVSMLMMLLHYIRRRLYINGGSYEWFQDLPKCTCIFDWKGFLNMHINELTKTMRLHQFETQMVSQLSKIAVLLSELKCQAS